MRIQLSILLLSLQICLLSKEIDLRKIGPVKKIKISLDSVSFPNNSPKPSKIMKIKISFFSFILFPLLKIFPNTYAIKKIYHQELHKEVLEYFFDVQEGIYHEKMNTLNGSSKGLYSLTYTKHVGAVGDPQKASDARNHPYKIYASLTFPSGL